MKKIIIIFSLFFTGCAADPPTPVPVPVPESTTQSKVHCNLIFPAPIQENVPKD